MGGGWVDGGWMVEGWWLDGWMDGGMVVGWMVEGWWMEGWWLDGEMVAGCHQGGGMQQRKPQVQLSRPGRCPHPAPAWAARSPLSPGCPAHPGWWPSPALAAAGWVSTPAPTWGHRVILGTASSHLLAPRLVSVGRRRARLLFPAPSSNWCRATSTARPRSHHVTQVQCPCPPRLCVVPWAAPAGKLRHGTPPPHP